MKKLETEFVMNADKRGDNTFKQIKRTDKVAMYRRFDMEGRGLEWEVFAIKVAGGDVFGRHYDKYEQYPGAAAFGRHAYSLASEEAAERIYAELVKTGGKKPKTPKPIKVKVKRPGAGKGRPKANRPEIKFPKRKWTMKDLAAANKKGWTKPTLYIEVTKLVKSGKVVEVDRVSQGRGRPTVFYKIKA